MVSRWRPHASHKGCAVPCVPNEEVQNVYCTFSYKAACRVLLCAGSIQCLIFGKKWFNSILLTQNSIQIKINSGDSIQKIFQFNCRGTIDTGLIRKVPISVKNRQKRRFLNQELKILKKINTKDYSIPFLGNIQFNRLFKYFFSENSIQKLIQKFKFGFIQFNKIFIQLENQGIEHH